MVTTIGLPEIVVEYKRYDADPTNPNAPDGWVFFRMTPDENGGEAPFEPAGPEGWKDMSDEELGAWYEEAAKSNYRGETHGWMRQEPAMEFRLAELDDYRAADWDSVPEVFRSYVCGCVLPLEWQSDVELMKSRTTIWLKGEWPA